MKSIPSPTAFATFALLCATLAFVAGCNTAQFTQPGPTDSGTGVCPSTTVFDCDAAAVTVGCGANDEAGIPSGVVYPFACVATLHAIDPAGECIISDLCTCSPSDAGPSVPTDGGDAGPATGPIGRWSCNQ